VNVDVRHKVTDAVAIVMVVDAVQTTAAKVAPQQTNLQHLPIIVARPRPTNVLIEHLRCVRTLTSKAKTAHVATAIVAAAAAIVVRTALRLVQNTLMVSPQRISQAMTIQHLKTVVHNQHAQHPPQAVCRMIR
jgi:hypothetical protein